MAAQVRLEAALLAGESTAPHRDAIDRLRSEIAKCNQAEHQTRADQSRFAAEKQKCRLTEIVAVVDAELQSLSARFSIPVFNEDDMSQHPAILKAADEVARAQAAFDNEQEPYRVATERVSILRSRLDEVIAAGGTILEQRRAGTLTEREAAGLVGLNAADQADLRKLLDEAEPELFKLAPRDERVKSAQQVLDRAVSQVKFDALTAHVKEIESVLCASIDNLYVMGRSLGQPSPLSASWEPSGALRDIQLYGKPPGGAR